MQHPLQPKPRGSGFRSKMWHLHSGAESGAHFLTKFRQLVILQCQIPSRHKPQALLRAHHLHGSRPLSFLARKADRGQIVQSRSQLIFRRHRGHLNYSSAAIEQVTHDSHSTVLTSEDQRPKDKVLLLMSGGVDSSMCAHILKNQGYDVTGLYMHNWNHQEETQDELESRPAHQQPWRSSSDSQHNDTLYLKESSVPSSNPSLKPSLSSETSRTPRTARIRPKICTSDRDWADVQAVCEQIGIPARRLDFSRQYWNQVFEVMLQEYENGRTPNPDVTCNREIKFGELIEWCNRNGGLGKDRHKHNEGTSASITHSNNVDNNDNIDRPGFSIPGWDYIATGHYARVELDPVTGKARLLRALDSNKDQTYYLSTLSERVLRNVIFPLAQFDKPTVKKMAMTTGVDQLKNAAEKKESMGICFVGQRRRFGEFLKEYLDTKPGPVRIDGLDGQIIGEHKGLFRYTVGQSSGVTMGHQKWVVLRTDLPSNTLIVVDGTQNKRLFSPGLIAEKWHWISGQPPRKLIEAIQDNNKSESLEDFPFTAQIRHRQVPQPCTVEPISNVSNEKVDLASTQLFRVRFKGLQRAVAPGQQLVLYDGDECLGGAVIQSSLPSPSTFE